MTRQAVRQRALRAEGQCGQSCGRPAQPGYSRCPACLTKDRARYVPRPRPQRGALHVPPGRHPFAGVVP